MFCGLFRVPHIRCIREDGGRRLRGPYDSDEADEELLYCVLVPYN